MIDALLTSASLLALKAFMPPMLLPALRKRQVQYQIARSLRFNSADSTYLSRVFGAGNQTTSTLSMWVKRSSLGTTQSLFIGGTSASSSTVYFLFNTSNQLHVANGAGSVVKTSTRVFRDESAWIHIVFVMDTNNGTAADRWRLYVNGERITSFAASADPSLGQTFNWNANGFTHTIGGRLTGPTDFFGGYATEINFVDGLALDASYFGEISPVTGAWEPIQYAGTYGTNGFYLDFSDNSNTTSSTLGKDRSGNNNDWTPNNFSVAAGAGNDVLTDTPTNYGTDTGAGGEVRANYCTLNPLDMLLAGSGGLSNGNLDFTEASAPATRSLVMGSQPLLDKTYFEATVGAVASTSYPLIGICDLAAPRNTASAWQGSNNLLQYGANGQKYQASSGAAFGNSFTTNDVIGVAVDMSAKKIWFRKNGTWEASGDPVAGTNPAFTFSFTEAAACIAAYNGASVRMNFGQRPFANAAPTGFKALCTQNLPDPAIKNPSKGFVATTESGANIEAALAALRSGWTDYIEIFKRTDSTEGWRWRFSDDTGNYLDSSSQNAKTTFPSLSGTTYVGYAIRCDAGYPARTGEASHTNGVATTITHNLGNARALICVKNSGAGSTDWWLYHPDNASGELLKLNSQDGDAANTTITNVTANSFQIGSAAATGTYRWFIIAEVDGFFELGTYTGNGSADGAAVFAGSDFEWLWIKNRGAGSTDHVLFSRVRNPNNVVTALTVPNGAVAEVTGLTALDWTAGGFKLRDNNSTRNGSSASYVYASFAKTAFKYARAA